MRSDLNLVLQIVAVGATVLLRITTPGWLLVIFFVFVPVATVALVTQIVLAAAAVRRGRLTTNVTLAFGVLAASGLGAAAVIPDGGDSERSINSPLGLLLGPDLPDLTWIGLLLLLTWVGALVWVIIGLATSRPVPPRPAPHPYWSGPAPAGLG
jgi:cation transport ATPase